MSPGWRLPLATRNLSSWDMTGVRQLRGIPHFYIGSV